MRRSEWLYRLGLLAMLAMIVPDSIKWP